MLHGCSPNSASDSASEWSPIAIATSAPTAGTTETARAFVPTGLRSRTDDCTTGAIVPRAIATVC